MERIAERPATDLIVETDLVALEPDIGVQDRAVLRALAADVPWLAALPSELEKRELWRRHNRLEPARPLIVVFQRNAWSEILPPDTLKCTDSIAREWELRLRQELFYGRRMADDYTIPPCFELAHVHREPDWRLAEERAGGENRTAYTWIPPVQSAGDIGRGALGSTDRHPADAALAAHPAGRKPPEAARRRSSACRDVRGPETARAL